MLKRDKHLPTEIALNKLCCKTEGAEKSVGHGWLTQLSVPRKMSTKAGRYI